jgi:brefeldin A-inhibited guanine nucleotide-exchange protein
VILKQAGPTFRSNSRYLAVLRSYLCTTLLLNCTSIHTQVVESSLRVFIELLTHFKAHLKGELEVFIANIFLGILESEHSTFEHKMLVLEVLQHICDDQTILSEIFLNYDCDWESIDLFKRIVYALAKITKRPMLNHHSSYFKEKTPSILPIQSAAQIQDGALVL